MRAGKGFTLLISNEDINVIIKIIKPLEDWSVLIANETLKHGIKKQDGGFLPALLAPLTALLVEPLTYLVVLVVKVITGRWVRRAEKVSFHTST